MPTKFQISTDFIQRTKCALATLVFVLCAPAFPSSAQSTENRKAEFELMHLWLTSIEAPALNVIRDKVLKAGLAWTEHRVEGNFYGITFALAERIAIGLPPTSVFWIGSLGHDSFANSTLFRSIPDSTPSHDFSESLHPEIRKRIHVDDGFASLPLVIHLQNVAVANLDAFARIGATPPSTWSQFLEMAPRLAAAGITPISVSEVRWLLRFLFLSVFAEGLSKSQFAAMLDGQVDRADFMEHAKRALTTFRDLKRFANRDSHQISWSDAIQQVLGGTAALTITGDFAAPGLRQHDNVVCTLAPGNEFVAWSFDVLAFPRPTSEEQSEAQEAAFRALSAVDALREFGIAKGGVPVIRNVDPASLDRCSRESLKNWQQKERVSLSYDHWRLQLNSIASLAQHVWQDDTLRLDDVATQLYQELALSLR
ncbi:MAG: extracellular solute-binding protein [Hyphomicrobiaceae bacterium]